MTNKARLTITYDDRDRPDITLQTRQPGRYDNPNLDPGGRVPADPEPGAAAGRLRFHHGGGGDKVRAEIAGLDDFPPLVLVIDRAEFVAWVEQLDHLRDRIRSGL